MTKAVPRKSTHRPVVTPASLRTPVALASGQLSPARLSFAAQRTEFLISAVGSGTALADVLGVARSQPTRWRKGQESPSPQTARELVDLDHVMARALMLFPQPVAMDWLTSANSYLDGSRPIDVLRTRGSSEVIAALDATMSGAFA